MLIASSLRREKSVSLQEHDGSLKANEFTVDSVDMNPVPASFSSSRRMRSSLLMTGVSSVIKKYSDHISVPVLMQKDIPAEEEGGESLGMAIGE